jgi:site-specific DNA-methyltransferase (adenine-specific)
MICKIFNSDCTKWLEKYKGRNFDLSFLDPPFNQAKEYRSHDDDMDPNIYWEWMTYVCRQIFNHSSDGAAIYFMQREKNVHFVLNALETTGWKFQNLIIWKKKTSAVPIKMGFGKHYQIIAYAIKGDKPRVFNKLRIDPPLLVTEKLPRQNGVYVTDVWDDIRELTSGYFAGDEPLRLDSGERLHKQQSPVQLLTRIILSSSKIDDLIFDPFAGTGTTLIVGKQLKRNSIGIEVDDLNCKYIKGRIIKLKKSDDISKLYYQYRFTEELEKIWTLQRPDSLLNKPDQPGLF